MADPSDSSAGSVVVAGASAASLAMAEVAMSDTIGMVMQNAVVAQRGMQTIMNAAVTVTLALIIAKGAQGSG